MIHPLIPLLISTCLCLAPFAGSVPAARTLIFVGDLQRTSFWERLLLREQNDNVRTVMMRRIAKERPDALIILGDLVQSGGSRSAWQNFDRFTAPVRASGIPMIPLLGNHEYRGDADSLASFFFSRFPEQRGCTWRIFRDGSVATLLLNSNFSELDSSTLQQQLSWYASTLAELQADASVGLIVVCTHHPPFTQSTVVAPSRRVRRVFVEPFLKTPKALLFFSGHTHSYEHFVVGGKHFIVTGGGGGPRQRVLTAHPTEEVHYRGAALRPFHYCELHVQGGRISVRVWMVNDALTQWSLGEEFSLPTEAPR